MPQASYLLSPNEWYDNSSTFSGNPCLSKKLLISIISSTLSYTESLALMINGIMNKKEDNYQRIAGSLLDALIQYAKRFSATENHNSMVELLKNTIFENLENCDFDLARAIKNSCFRVK